MKRADVPTPAAIVDVDALERNIARMADRVRPFGVALRPHAKTHKCAAIARLQIAAGAVGICCAKFGEAEALADAGVADILVTSPCATPALAQRAAALSARGVRLAVNVDHPAGASALATAAREAGVIVDVFVDVDVGLRRTGVASPQAAAELAQAIAGSPALRFQGVQGYGGHLQHIAGLEGRRSATETATDRLRAAVEATKAAGLPVEVVTGGGTGTIGTDLELGLFNELQPGSYIFMDREYRDALCEDDDGRFETALQIDASVISANAAPFVTVDAGLKAFATDAGVPVPLGRYSGSSYFFFGDEQGGLTRTAEVALALGDRVAFMAPHCDPTVDRYDRLYFVRGNEVVDVVPVEGRGRSQ